MNSLRRLVLALLAVAASTLVAVGVATPAHAATTITTRVVYLITPAKSVQYGHAITITTQVQGYLDGQWDWVDNGWGTVALQSHVVGGSSWKTVQTSTWDERKTWTIKPARNTYYRVVYKGYNDTADGVVLNPSNGAARFVHVRLNLHDSLHGKTVSGTVKPAYHNKKIYVEKSSCKTGCGYHVMKTIRTNGTGHYSYRLPVYKKKTWFQLVAPASKSFAASSSNHYFYTVRG